MNRKKNRSNLYFKCPVEALKPRKHTLQKLSPWLTNVRICVEKTKHVFLSEEQIWKYMIKKVRLLIALGHFGKYNVPWYLWDWFQESLWIPKSSVAQILYIKWCHAVNTVNSPMCGFNQSVTPVDTKGQQ